MEKIIELFVRIFTQQSLIKVVFANPRKKSQPCHKAVLRPILLQGDIKYQVEYHYEKKVTHENLNSEECLDLIRQLICDSFKQINLFTAEADYQILASKPENPKLVKKAPTMERKNLDHNLSKQYILPDGKPCDFLIHLGVMNKDGKVLQKHYAKFRQINRFLEIVSDVLEHLNTEPTGKALVGTSPKEESAAASRPLRIIDFGCGKAYLTFALYHYLNKILKKNIEIIGLDLKEDVIAFCNQVAENLHYDGLKFLIGDIADYTGSDRADMVVTLHACDTATDYALIKAVGWNASVILSVPCCQHELFNQIKNPLHQPMFKHGILKERFTSILTDGLRVLKLEEKGYEVSMIEFTSLEHTAKNIMIRAVKTDKKNKAAGEEYQQLKDYWNVNPTIDKL